MQSVFENLRKKLFATVIATFAVVLLGTVVANAQCGYFDGHKAPGSIWQQQSSQPQAKLRPASLLLVSDPGDSDSMSIVGFWKFKFVSEGNESMGIPNGTVIDFGFAQWHSDGTEIINSGGRDPRSGNFCLGIWKKTGGSTYKLNHFPLVWDDSGHFVGPANLVEHVTVQHGGNSYAGSFTITQYDPTGKINLGSVGGTVTAIRITVDTMVPDIF